MTSFLTVLKSTYTTAFFVLLLLGVVIFIKRKWEDEMQKKESTHG